jgi:hypothetical protein
MAATNVKLRMVASAGALVLITGCGAATAVPSPPDGEETPGPSDDDGGSEPSDDPDPAGDEYRLDCRKRGSEILPC